MISLLFVLSVACGGERPEPVSPADVARPDDARGGRLFDRWMSEAQGAPFQPDSHATPGVADGSGGPRGDGTLLFADGRVLLNDGAHDYRLKNLFGWDLRGRAGLYGPDRMAKSYAVDGDLLSWTGGVSEVADRFAQGDAQVPALGPVLSRAELEDLASFVVRMRDGELPRPDSIYTLTSADAGHYALREGGDAARGRAMFAERCAGCHGADGTGMLFDGGAFSLGSHARQKAYEDWLKILNGQPGSEMDRQVRGATAAEMTQELLDLFAALCDREAFPVGAATSADVADGDPRCGAYLR